MCAASARCWCCGGWWSSRPTASADGSRACGRAACNWDCRLRSCLRWAELRGRLSDSAMIGTSFALGLAGALFVLLVLAAVTLRTLRAILNRVRLRLPSSLRHGLANLYRPGNQSAPVLAALGTGVMLILAVYLMQSSILQRDSRDRRANLAERVPDRCDYGRGCRGEGVLSAPGRREPAAGPDARALRAGSFR